MAIRVNSLPKSRDWKYLTLFGQKKSFFTSETYFRESWFDLHQVAGDHAVDLLTRTAMLVLKPEALAARKAEVTLAALMENGFFPILARPVRYHRHAIREIWRYQFSEATIDRLELVDDLYTLGEGLLLLLDDRSSPRKMPASARLHHLKGASEARLRGDHTLRTRLGSPNGVVRFLHVADEPADVVREIGVLFSREERVALWRALATSRFDDLDEIRNLARAMEDGIEPCAFCARDSWNRILSGIEGRDDQTARTIRDRHQAWQARGVIGLEDLRAALAQIGAHRHDVLTIAAEVIQQNVDYEFHLIDHDALRGWNSRLFEPAEIPAEVPSLIAQV